MVPVTNVCLVEHSIHFYWCDAKVINDVEWLWLAIQLTNSLIVDYD
jgi:hypothetical protein